MPLPERVLDWIRANRATALIIGIALVGVGLLALTVLGGGGFNTFSAATQEQAALDRTGKFATAPSRGGGAGDAGDTGGGGGAFVEVQEANFEIETDSAEKASDAIRGTATQMGGYVEESRKSESSLHTTIRMTVRVPDENFERFNQHLRQQYNVESYTVRNHRISIQRTLDELTIINRSLEQYQRMREEVRRMDVSEEKIDLLMRITEKQLELKERQKRFLRDLSSAQQRSRMATVTIELREEKDVDLTPDNVWNRFKNAVKDMLDTITEIVINTVTDGIELFFKVIQLIIYAVIVLVPVGFAYRIGRRLYDEYWPQADDGGNGGGGQNGGRRSRKRQDGRQRGQREGR